MYSDDENQHMYPPALCSSRPSLSSYPPAFPDITYPSPIALTTCLPRQEFHADGGEAEAGLPPWEHGISRQLRRLDSVNPGVALAPAGAASRRSHRVTRVNKDASSPFDDLMHRVVQEKISQLAPHPDVKKYLSSPFRAAPTSPSVAAAGSRSAGRAGEGSAGEVGDSEKEGRRESAGAGAAQEFGSSRTMRCDPLAAWGDVVDINALD